MGAPKWPPYPQMLGAPRRSRGTPRCCAMAGPRHGPMPPHARGAPAAPLDDASWYRRREMDLGLKGKVALVTAASKGMGRACAQGLAAEGARVAMCARNEGELKAAADELRAKTKADVLAVRADVTKAAEVTALVGQVKQAFGDPDILIANCGGPPRGFFDEFTDQAWHGAVEGSLMSTVRLIRAVLPGKRP